MNVLLYYNQGTATRIGNRKNTPDISHEMNNAAIGMWWWQSPSPKKSGRSPSAKKSIMCKTNIPIEISTPDVLRRFPSIACHYFTIGARAKNSYKIWCHGNDRFRIMSLSSLVMLRYCLEDSRFLFEFILLYAGSQPLEKWNETLHALWSLYWFCKWWWVQHCLWRLGVLLFGKRKPQSKILPLLPSYGILSPSTPLCSKQK